jgi:hypothetical protein
MWVAAIAAIFGTLWATGQTPAHIVGHDAAPQAQVAQVAANAQAVKDSGEAVGYWHDIAVTATKQLDDMRVQIDAARDKKDAATNKAIAGAQYFNAATIEALRRIPSDKRCPETILATLMAAKTDAALTGLMGQMTPAQQKEVAELVLQFLSSDEAQREDAQKKLDAKDAELRTALHDRDLAQGQVDGLHAAVAAQKVAVDSAQTHETAAVKTLNERTEALSEEITSQSLRAASDVWFWRYWFIGFVALLVITGRLLPLFCKTFGWAWLAPVNKFNAFLFRFMTGKHAVDDEDYKTLTAAKSKAFN